MTATMKRTDVHRPSAINPDDYRFVTCLYLGGGDLGAVMMNLECRAILHADMERTKGTWSGHDHGGTCHICGATALYVAIYYHELTNTYIKCGEDCALKMDMGDVAAFNPLRRAIADGRAAIAGKNKARTILEDANLTEVWEVYNMQREGDEVQKLGYTTPYNSDMGVLHCEIKPLQIMREIVGRLVKYGNISEKQLAYLPVLLKQMHNHKQVMAEREAEKAKAEPCPSGKVQICGTIVKYSLHEGYYGNSWKITVKDDRGFLVWGTCPAGELCKETAVGAKVRFMAGVTPSDSDPKFGFYKRPSKFEVLEIKCDSSQD